MNTVDYHELVEYLGSGDVVKYNAAKVILLALQENAVNPLGDEFYAGVTEAQGIGILQVVADIGGPDAMAMLRNVFEFERERPALRFTAAEGLMQNRHNLSPDEETHVAFFLANNSNHSR